MVNFIYYFFKTIIFLIDLICSFCQFHSPSENQCSSTEESIVNAGENLTLTCKADGDPQPTITWTRDGVSENQFRKTENVLQLSNVQTKDVGSYRCSVANGYGTDLTRISLVGLSCKDKLMSSLCRFQIFVFSFFNLRIILSSCLIFF